LPVRKGAVRFVNPIPAVRTPAINIYLAVSDYQTDFVEVFPGVGGFPGNPQKLVIVIEEIFNMDINLAICDIPDEFNPSGTTVCGPCPGT
jgi:hypothetical protein